MTESGIATEKSTPLSPGRKTLTYWKTAIRSKVKQNEAESKRLGADPSIRPERDKRHQAAKELRLERKAAINALTGLMNKEVYEAERDRILGVIDRDISAPLAVGIIIDLDDFGLFNKNYGNPAGDEVLRAVGRTILETFRETDLAGRIGGEEMEITAQKTRNPDRNSQETSVELAEKIRKAIERIRTEKGYDVKASVGTTTYVRGEGKEAYKTRLEDALIIAKRLGKNRTVHTYELEGRKSALDTTTGIEFFYEKSAEGKIITESTI